MRTGKLLYDHMARQLRQSQRALGALGRPGATPESIHRLRVSLRRLRLLLIIAAETGRKDFSAASNQLKNGLQAIGPLRDHQMFARWLHEQRVQRRLPARVLDSCKGWLYKAERSEGKVLARRRAHLCHLLKALEPRRWAESLGQITRKRIRRLLRKNAKRLVAAMEEVPASPNAPALHRIRRQVRRMRYLTEFFGKKERPRRRLLSRLKAWQTLLGQAQDMDAASRICREMTAALPLAERQRLRTCKLAGLLRQQKRRHEKDFIRSLSRRRRHRLVRWAEKLETV